MFEALKKTCADCGKCDLHRGRTNSVFGYGAEDAKIVFVGEGPGQQEDLSGKPFVGRSGQLLDTYLNRVGLSRETNVYIANIVKCRPPENRDPKPEEREACMPYLKEQLAILKPKFVVCLGRIAAQELISPTFKVTQEHGIWFEKDGIEWMGTFHPAALLRNPNDKPVAFEDFVSLREKAQQAGIL